MDAMDIHGCHGYPWMPWISMDAMDIHGIHYFNFFLTENQRTPKNSCKTSAQSPNSLDTNPKGGNGPLRIFLAYAQEIHFLSTKCLLDFGQGCNIWRNLFFGKILEPRHRPMEPRRDPPKQGPRMAPEALDAIFRHRISRRFRKWQRECLKLNFRQV